MKVNGKTFDGSTHFLDTYRRLRSIAGNASWFTGYRPILFPGKEYIQLLLLELFKHHICCYLTGTFVSFTTGGFQFFQGSHIIQGVSKPMSQTFPGYSSPQNKQKSSYQHGSKSEQVPRYPVLCRNPRNASKTAELPFHIRFYRQWLAIRRCSLFTLELFQGGCSLTEWEIERSSMQIQAKAVSSRNSTSKESFIQL